ncbi:hypothetical protein SAMN04487981_10274 [Streptomyces sp. cf386]|uniref:hypothetical protein n=1 Tax=Streptomyces sp. cf386 TaxID=1761904 RepID=UPI000890BDE1|nr:hypothetical protein [Streptomyces sp. cf386]SDM63591.1 hypothetical protein SAMN04487981_10274 [Streptomyces sp. cf386]
MEIAFKASFVLATAVEVVLVAVLVLQLWRRQRHASTRPLVVTYGDVLTGAALFGGTMTVTALFARGWDSASSADTLLYAVTFGIVTAGLATYLRRGDGARSAYRHLAQLLPVGFGVLAGLAAG